MRKKIGLIIFSLIGLLGVMLFQRISGEKHEVFINEICSVTTSTNKDGYYGSDYIELFNNSNEEIQLDGWYLSDDESDLKKSKLLNITIPSKGYQTLWCEEAEEEKTLNFKISSKGEKIFLSNANGELMDSVLVPELRYGEAYGRKEDGHSEWVIMTETLNENNALAAILPERTLDVPFFSHESGFYDEAFELKLECNYGEEIFYTLDGSVPTKKSLKYTEPIVIENVSDYPNVIRAVRNVIDNWLDWEPNPEPVDKATVIRAISINENDCVSEVVTKTYFVGLDKYEQQNIVSVVADYEDLFGDNGIFVTGKRYDEKYISGELDNLPEPNYVKSGRQWEIPGNLQIFNNGKEVCNQPAGIRVYGGSSREGKVKRMSYYARKAYDGNEYFEGITLENRKIHSFGLNGSIGNSILPQLVYDRAVAVQGVQSVKVFLNGEYYFEAGLAEKYSKQYFEQKYGVQGDNILVIKDGELSEGPDEAELLYKWLQKQAATLDLSVQENYEEIQQLMDIQSYIDYICANVYLCNMDMSQVKNYMLWRTIEDEETEYGDSRFRWILYDMGALDDQISYSYYQIGNKAEVNSFIRKGRYVGHSINEHTIYQALKKNKTYCKQFVLSFMDMANVNFEPGNVNKIFEKYNFSKNIYGDFFEKRFAYIVPYMAEEFGLMGTLENVILKVNDVEGGTIQLNTTTPDLSEGTWIGKYYTDYPITVTAVPADGYEFVSWSGSVTSANDAIEAEVTEGGITLEAVFQKTAN